MAEKKLLSDEQLDQVTGGVATDKAAASLFRDSLKQDTAAINGALPVIEDLNAAASGIRTAKDSL